jgi:inward rectifier potassium channel
VIAPKSDAANVVAAFESLTGVLGFAVATGLLFGRVSRPSAKIGYSANVLIAPYQDGRALMFRVVNRRRNDLVELEARVMLMTVEPRDGGGSVRRYTLLRLERDKVLFLPLTWTIVHAIDEQSPLNGITAEDLDRLQAEILILIKAYDDTFSQNVLSRYSYRHDEFAWHKRFAPAFDVDREGDLVLDIEKVGQYGDAS